MELRLLSWIDRAQLDIQFLHSNPRALEAGWVDPRVESYWVACNPAAADHIRDNIYNFIEHSSIWENSAVFDDLLASGFEIEPEWFSSNSHPKAIELLIAGKVEMRIDLFNENPGAIHWLREHPDKIDNAHICANPEAIDIIQSLDNLKYKWLSKNPHPWAIEQLRTHQDKIDWDWFSANPGIFEYRIPEGLVEALTRDS
jgi:hypothetical protein